nr:hypothetical protein CFP56_52378 [Quercus suber]
MSGMGQPEGPAHALPSIPRLSDVRAQQLRLQDHEHATCHPAHPAKTRAARLFHLQTRTWLVPDVKPHGRPGCQLPHRQKVPHSSLPRSIPLHCHPHVLTFFSSPQAPTPRRSLFTANLFQPREETGMLLCGRAGPPCVGTFMGIRSKTDSVQERCITTPIDIEEVTTPPIIASSSPGFDGMDISPLPHKAPYFQVTLPSPSPVEAPESADLITPDLLSPLEIPTPLHALAVQPPSFLPLPE